MIENDGEVRGGKIIRARETVGKRKRYEKGKICRKEKGALDHIREDPERISLTLSS